MAELDTREDVKALLSWFTITRLEVLLTVVYDGLLIVACLIFRQFMLWILERAGIHGTEWPVRAAEFIIDFGFLGAIIVMTVFDLLKRIQRGFGFGKSKKSE